MSIFSNPFSSGEDAAKQLINSLNFAFEQMYNSLQKLEGEVAHIHSSIESETSVLSTFKNDIVTIKDKLVSFEQEINSDAENGMLQGVAEAEQLIESVKTFIKEAYAYLQSIIPDYEQWKTNEAPTFRQNLVSFTDNLLEVPENITQLLVHVHFNHPGHEIAQIINDIPDFALYVIAKGLKHFNGPDGQPAWLTQSASIKELSSHIQPKEAIIDLVKSNPIKTAELKTGLKDLKLFISILSPTMVFLKSLCPEDLTVNLDVLGEGGGTEVAGHPIKIPFDLIKWITALTSVACDEALEIISDNSAS